jgi:hypothetical protein
VLVVRQSHGRGFLPFPIGTGDLGLDGVQHPGSLLEQIFIVIHMYKYKIRTTVVQQLASWLAMCHSFASMLPLTRLILLQMHLSIGITCQVCVLNVTYK